MREYFFTFLKSVLSYITLLLLTRVMGKKQMSQMTSIDYIVGITIGSIVASISVDRSLNDIDGIIATLCWALLPIIIAKIGLVNVKFRRLTDGESSIIIDRGQVNDINMKKARYNMKDLLMQLRQKDIFDLAEVEFAVLEPNGELSVLKKQQYNTVTLKDMNIKGDNKGMVIDVILSGRIIHDHLRMINKDRTWLLKELERKSVKEIKDVIYAGVTLDKNVEIVMTNNTKKT